jgi:ribosomal protein S18 acetylase RimI-like enzyme
MNYAIRPVNPVDEAFLWQMLFEAAHLAEEGETSVEAVINHPEISKYVQDWGRVGDLGFVAIENALNQPIGAAWLRLFSSHNRGYAYLNAETPELAVAVLPAYRHQGIGTQLIQHLLAAAKTIYPAVSLSVRTNNPVFKLYQRLGFEIVSGSEVINRTGGTSLIMKIDLDGILAS